MGKGKRDPRSSFASTQKLASGTVNAISITSGNDGADRTLLF